MGACLSFPPDAVVESKPRSQPTTPTTVTRTVTIDDELKIVEDLGPNSIWNVQVASQGGKTYSLKTIRLGRLSRSFVKELNDQLQIVRELKHPGLANIFNIEYTDHTVILKTEHCTGGNLYQRAPYTETQSLQITKQLLKTLAYIHKRGFVHNDIKFENIMYKSPDSKMVKIADFGLTAPYNPARPLQAQLGVLQTMAPEVFTGNFSTQCDMWSLGVVVFELLGGAKPFKNPSVIALMNAIAGAKYSFEPAVNWSNKSIAAKNFCRELLEKEPNTRLTAMEASQHKWLQREEAVETPTAKGITPLNWLSPSKTPSMQKLVTFLAKRQSFDTEIKELRKAFEKADPEGYGAIPYENFKEAVFAVFGSFDFEDEEAKENVPETFDDKEAKVEPEAPEAVVSYTKIISEALSEHTYRIEEVLVKEFDEKDQEAARYIDTATASAVLGRELPAKQANRLMMDLSDIDEDGVTYDQFFRVFRREADKLAVDLLSEREAIVPSRAVDI